MSKLKPIVSYSLLTISCICILPVATFANETPSQNNQVNSAQNAASTEITAINIQESDQGITLIIETANGKTPEGEIIDNDTDVVIKLTDVKLNLPDGNNFLKNQPMEGINSISVTQTSATEVEIKITGNGTLPNVEQVENQQGLTLSIIPTPKTVLTENNQSEDSIELSVVGTRNVDETTPANVTIINREQIEKQQARDVRDLLRYEPGISVPYDSRGGLQGINLRGLSGNRVNLQVDGIRLPYEYNYGATRLGRDFVDIETLNALEIFRGNNSAALGSDALGGTVNFATASTREFLESIGKNSYTSLRAQYSSKDSGFVGTFTQANRLDNFDTLFIYTRRDSGSLDVAGGNSIYQDDQDRTRNNFLGKLTYNFNEQSFLEFTGEYFNNVTDSKFSTANLPGMIFEASTQDLQEEVTTNRERFSLAYQYDDPNSKSWLQFARAHIYYQNAITEEDSNRSVRTAGTIRTEAAEKDLTDRVFGVNLQLRSDFNVGNTKHRLTSGFDISNTYNERNYFNFITTTGTRVNAPTFPQKDFPDSDTFRLGTYLQNEISFGNGQVKLIPGLRFDFYNLTTANNPEFTQKQQGIDAVNYSTSAISPSLGIVYEPSPGLTLFSRYSRGFRPPLYSELNFAFRADIPFRPHKGISNPNLQAETSNNFELGLRSRSQQFDFDITGFYNRYSNFIEPSVFVGFDPNDFGTFRTAGRAIPFQIFQAQNIPDAEIYGLEIKTAYRFSKEPGGFSLKGALGWQVGNNLTRDIPLTTINPLQAVIGLGYQSPNDKWGAELIGTFVAKSREQALVDDQTSVQNGGQPTRKIDFYEPDAYTLVDFVGYYNINPNLTLTAGVYNIFNTEYYQYADVRSINRSAATFEAQRGRYAQPGTNFAVGLTWRF
ncbi:TonB-dependent heme/hemoglobin receptor family protein/TonB-dependent hemoglobin/transferrin/lactoferrin receptor family protein [Nostoc sp. PCC 7524]|uniref:TonB-dependent hemoglobin/transferrin/lactoferrin family receptor n=1 Tax=Nostoc sp. (strain ATCC 29411 / PCC 7524) TaxID=28072 RepID=UPI00029EF369|nr:TonB-dependent hemoglobin/transferrin/lactoferrin family receptor [Nostoc sp. PCC 7524]AFY45992.1 TonB-dependent heme/hemoglobin receptor family protein/TonB-dependent hemoglobin/transferrin/lactoferrin receptor family protein [Nostoc sp. PCC 7524]